MGFMGGLGWVGLVGLHEFSSSLFAPHFDIEGLVVVVVVRLVWGSSVRGTQLDMRRCIFINLYYRKSSKSASAVDRVGEIIYTKSLKLSRASPNINSLGLILTN